MDFILPPWVKWAALAVLALSLYACGRHDGKAIKDAELSDYRRQVAEANLKSQADARAKEQANQAKQQEAQNAAKERENKLRAAADAARNESERMRADLASIRSKLPSLAEAAVRQYADTASVVFDECQRRYSELAATADRIDNDRQTLMDAWPK